MGDERRSMRSSVLLSCVLPAGCIAGAVTAGPTSAASPDYCAVYARETARQVISKDESQLASDLVYDRLYHKCLNMDEEPALPAAYAETQASGSAAAADDGAITSILEDAATGSPTVDATAIDESVVKRTAAIESGKTTTPARRTGRWRGSGFATGSSQWRDWCAEHFPNSFDPQTGTILPYGKDEREPCL